METVLNTELTVAAAVIEYRKRFLLAKRAAHKENPGMWEFPGGKLSPGESIKNCVERELKEELGVMATAGRILGSVNSMAGKRNIALYAVETLIDHEPTELKDHSEIQWVKAEDFSQFPMTEAELLLISRLDLMREKEIVRVNLWSVVKFFGILYGGVGIFMAAFLMVSSQAFPFPVSMSYKILAAIMFPFFNLFFGGFLGLVLALFYNFVSNIVGGFKVTVK